MPFLVHLNFVLIIFAILLYLQVLRTKIALSPLSCSGTHSSTSEYQSASKLARLQICSQRTSSQLASLEHMHKQFCLHVVSSLVCVQVYEDGDAPPNHAERGCAAEVYFNNFTTKTHAPLRSVQHNLSTSLSMNVQRLFPIPWQTDGTSTVSYAAPFVIRALLLLLRWDVLESHRGNPTQHEADSLLLKGAPEISSK